MTACLFTFRHTSILTYLLTTHGRYVYATKIINWFTFILFQGDASTRNGHYWVSNICISVWVGCRNSVLLDMVFGFFNGCNSNFWVRQQACYYINNICRLKFRAGELKRNQLLIDLSSSTTNLCRLTSWLPLITALFGSQLSVPLELTFFDLYSNLCVLFEVLFEI